MVKYRLHNITNFGVEINDFCNENSLNNYIALFVESPYWVENLETHENIYTGFDSNVSRETLHETEIEWIKRHTTIEEKESCTKLEKILYFLCFLSVIIMAIFLLYLFLSTVSFIVEYFSSFTWKVFNIL